MTGWEPEKILGKHKTKQNKTNNTIQYS